MNGTGNKLVWTVMVSSCGVVVVGLMAWMTSLNAHIATIEASTSVRGERLSALESIVQTVNMRLTRMEDKLDMLIEQKSNSPMKRGQ